MTWVAVPPGASASLAGCRVPRRVGLGFLAVGGGWRGLGMAAAGAAPGGGDVKPGPLGPGGILVAAVPAAISGGLWAAAAGLRKPGAAAIPFATALVPGARASWFGGGS